MTNRPDPFAHLVAPGSTLAPRPPTLESAHPMARQYAAVALKMAMQILTLMVDEVSFQAGKKAIAALVGPELGDKLGPHFNPQVLAQAAAVGKQAMAQLVAHEQQQQPVAPQGPPQP